jgi:hypothetical protein
MRVTGDFREHRLFGENRENRRRLGSRGTGGERIERQGNRTLRAHWNLPSEPASAVLYCE